MEKSEKTRKFLIATHGTFAAGVKSSLDIIIGAIDHVFLIQAYVDEAVSVESQINEVMEQIGENDELVIFCDILGGSITNQVLQHALRSNVHIVSGFNLPLLIEVLMADAETPVEEVITSSIENAKEQMTYVNKLITVEREHPDD
ncbi:MAG: PTS fructose transporter subunit IIA [Bacteroidota bacterium]|nr:PTS fructose transporter subunit IIA [Bacteroidota bacterium]